MSGRYYEEIEDSSGRDAEKYAQTRKEVGRICGEFGKALSAYDIRASRAALWALGRLVKDGEEELYLMPGDERMIRDYSEFLLAEDNFETGEGGRRMFSCFFNPYVGSPDDMLETAESLKSPEETGITRLLSETECFLVEPPLYSGELKEAAYLYLEKWLLQLLVLTGEHMDELMSDPGKDGLSGPTALGFLLNALIAERHFDAVTERAFSLFPESTEEAEAGIPGPYSPLNTAVRTGNMKAFERLYASEKVKALVHPEEGRLKNAGKICCYPEESPQMLECLFSLGLLIPGTEEGERAFIYTLTHWNISREILKRIIHPSYFDRNPSLLVLAAKNEKFSPDGYSLLVGKPEDITGEGIDSWVLPPIAYAVKSGDREKVEALLLLGADIFWHDRWGNNILHRLIAEGWDTDRGEEVEEYISALREEKNIFGRLPSDYDRYLSPGSVGETESIGFKEALRKITTRPGRRVLFSFEPGRYGFPTATLRAMGLYMDTQRGWFRAAACDFEFVNQIRCIRNMSEDGSRNCLLIISLLDLFLEKEAVPLVKELEKRENVTLVYAVAGDWETFKAAENIADYDSVFVSRTSSPLIGDILIGRKDTSSLKDDEFLLRMDGEYFLVKASFPGK